MGPPVQADTPSRMSRQGAARTYHSYLNWGYFQRRMALQRSGEAGADPASSSDGSSSRNSSGMVEGGESSSGRDRGEQGEEETSGRSAAQEQAVDSQRSYAGEGALCTGCRL